MPDDDVRAETRTGAPYLHLDGWWCPPESAYDGCGASGPWPPEDPDGAPYPDDPSDVDGDAPVPAYLCPSCGQGPIAHVVIASIDPIAPLPYALPTDNLVHSRTSQGDHAFTWREIAERHYDRLTELAPLVTFGEDLDRCEHGRHAGDVCGSCGGPSVGNPFTRDHGAISVACSIAGRVYRVEPRGTEQRAALSLGGERIYPPARPPRS